MEKMKALIIEDSADCASLLNHYLIESKMFGEIRVVTNGEDGVEDLKTSVPDLIFLDLSLPGEYGIETLTKIKSLPETHSVPVIIMTASEDRKDLTDTYRKGGVLFIHKPLQKELLMEALTHMKVTGILKRGEK